MNYKIRGFHFWCFWWRATPYFSKTEREMALLFFSLYFQLSFFFRGTVKWKFVPWNPGLMLTGILSNNSRQEFLFDTTLITLPHSTNNATKQDLRQKTLFRSIEFLKSQINKTQLTFFSQLSFLLPFFCIKYPKFLMRTINWKVSNLVKHRVSKNCKSIENWNLLWTHE